jgi:hypothetical protein
MPVYALDVALLGGAVVGVVLLELGPGAAFSVFSEGTE